ncbi:MAG: RNA-binding transcriptional accessory protein [Bacteroidaceae bacterium]|nr:RNA-binding transcriptional accessory protein [Bacteroidaceae bacterium]
MNNIASIIADRLSFPANCVSAVMELLDGGATIPFISRYRKEATGAMDEVGVAAVAEQYDKLKEMVKRKETIISTIEEQGRMTADLRKRIDCCWDSTELEDIYLPFKPKRRTKAQIAREHGLEPLATQLLLERLATDSDLERTARQFVKGEVKTADQALQGARDIIAESMCEEEACRNAVRREFTYTAKIVSKVVKGKEEEAAKYRDYFNFSEPLKRCSSHRLLAMRRGESEGFLRVSVSPDDDLAIEKLMRRKVHRSGAASRQIEMAVNDGYKRLLKPQIETEFAAMSKEKADAEAIAVFASGLRQLLLAAPLGQKRTLGIDPGFRTGCKVVCLDAQGNLLHHTVVYLHRQEEAAQTLRRLVRQYGIEAAAIGNGTAGRETEQFVRSLFAEDGILALASGAGRLRNSSSEHSGARSGKQIEIFSVNEDGASVYSASAAAREEFPNEDVTVRGAVSIARRLMDPLAELVKIDSKSIGVGQYQHDVDQSALKRQLDLVVESCVNSVGVDVNTASKHLLTYVSGLGPVLAQNIVDYRAANGAFRNRKALMKVPRMGAKTFEQCAGFLRIQGGDNPLDNSAVHPESYGVVEQMAKDLRCTVSELMANPQLRAAIDRKKYSAVGEATLSDIMKELDKPSRDPRQPLKEFCFAPNVHTPEDLRVGMHLPGIVSNVTNFGAFVDIGVHEKGLVHVSQLADYYVKDPTTVVHIGEQVEVTVIDIDLKRNRISLSMKGN